MIAVTTDHLYAGALGAAARVVVVCIVLVLMAALIWLLLIGSLVFVDWLDRWWDALRNGTPEQLDPIRRPVGLDPFVVQPQLGGAYHIVNSKTGDVVATSGWLWEAERLRNEAALAWYKEQRRAREEAGA